MPPRADTQWLQLRLLDDQLAHWPALDVAQEPPGGWVAAIRQAIGMSRAQLAQRLGITRSSVLKLEQREAQGGATLGALRSAADAMGCDLVYALVPRSGSLDATVQARATLVADRLVDRTGHTMGLEAQAVHDDESRAQRQAIARRLLVEWPRDLWDPSWDASDHDR
jgi:predicted DNA-binding mobile mystery protein A